MILKYVWFCGGVALKLNDYNLNLSDEGKSYSNPCWVLQVNPNCFKCLKMIIG